MPNGRSYVTITVRRGSLLVAKDTKAPHHSFHHLHEPFFRTDPAIGQNLMVPHGLFDLLWVGEVDGVMVTPPWAGGRPNQEMHAALSKLGGVWSAFFVAEDIDEFLGRQGTMHSRWFSKQLADPGAVSSGVHSQLRGAEEGRDYFHEVLVWDDANDPEGSRRAVTLVSGSLVQSVLRNLRASTVLGSLSANDQALANNDPDARTDFLHIWSNTVAHIPRRLTTHDALFDVEGMLNGLLRTLAENPMTEALRVLSTVTPFFGNRGAWAEVFGSRSASTFQNALQHAAENGVGAPGNAEKDPRTVDRFCADRTKTMSVVYDDAWLMLDPDLTEAPWTFKKTDVGSGVTSVEPQYFLNIPVSWAWQKYDLAMQGSSCRLGRTSFFRWISEMDNVSYQKSLWWPRRCGARQRAAHRRPEEGAGAIERALRDVPREQRLNKNRVY